MLNNVIDRSLALPVIDLDTASQWHSEHFGMQDGAAVSVSNARGIKDELEAEGVNVGEPLTEAA